MPSLYDESKLYQGVIWTLIGTVGAVLVLFIAAMIMYIDAAVRLNRQQGIGKRLEQECGKEVTERETERYYIYQMFEENKLSKQIVSTTAVIRSATALIIFGFLIAYILWTALIFFGSTPRTSASPPDPIFSKFNFFITKPKVNTALFGGIIFILVSLLSTGAAASFVRVRDATKYRINLTSTNADEAVADTLKGLNKKLRKLRGIDSPWFSISFIIAYAVIMHVCITKFAGTYNMKVGEFADGNRISRWGVILWALLIILYFIASFAAWFVDKDSRNLFATISGSYVAKKNELQRNITNLFASGTPDKYVKQFRQYFKTSIETVFPKTEVLINLNDSSNEYSSQLWKFIQHKSGREMSEIYAQVENSENVNDDAVRNTIDQVRKWALKMRMMHQPIRAAVNKFCKNAMIFGTTLFVLILFAVFNFVSRAWSSTNTMIASLGLIFFFAIVSSWFGWFSSALML
jgi:hypothetical protein